MYVDRLGSRTNKMLSNHVSASFLHHIRLVVYIALAPLRYKTT